MEKSTQVINELGMHARPAGVIAKMADEAQSDIWLQVNSNKVDATSIIDILTLGAAKGTIVVVGIKDRQDAQILDRIVGFFESGFGEM